MINSAGYNLFHPAELIYAGKHTSKSQYSMKSIRRQTHHPNGRAAAPAF
jgi:hypothetical protein